MIKLIDINKLYPHPQNPRLDLGDITELADSIKAVGILQNLTVVKGHKITHDEWSDLSRQYDETPTEELRNKMNSRKSEDGYTVIIGHRRLEAAKLAGITELPCVIADMDEKTQVGIMLLENIQRDDLTIYEQAQGFQMMMDLGETVDSVAEKTGFSKSTIRRRLKIAALDKDIMQQVSTRQVNLSDYDRLDEIEDIEKRNEVLADIGTANFNNKLEKTLHEQKEEKTRQQWLKIFADYSMTEIKANELWSSKYMDLGCLSGEPNDEKISDYIKQYDNLYYAFAYGHSPYIRADRSDSEEQSAEEIERKRKNEEAQRRRDEMRDLFSRAFKLRLNFIKNYSFTDSKKNVDKIANWAHIREIVSLINRGMLFSGATTMDTNSKMLKELYGINDKEDYSVVAEFTKKHPEKALLMTVYAQWCDSEYNDCYNWEGNYKENQALNELYRGLCALGYQMSDEEKQMLDGSHPIYSNPDDGVIDTAYDKIETETEDEISDDEFDIDLEKRLAELANQKIRED